MANIKVAVRVRPPNFAKNSGDHRSTISICGNGNYVKLQHFNAIDYLGNERCNTNNVRIFPFDFCYWSAEPNQANYASQEKVFEDIGKEVVEALLDGYNGCVLAYGQSGAGKTYTMIGTQSEPGIIPRLCQSMFESIQQRCQSSDKVSFHIEVSFMEIYNEKVRDLLRPATTNNDDWRLRVREHPQFGTYVQDLSRHTVKESGEALHLLQSGQQRRTSAATASNRNSSRSHALFTVYCTAAHVDDDFPRETIAKLHLVDLAGSERASPNTSQSRLKEGATINKSLTALGNVINALAERSNVDGLKSTPGSKKNRPSLFIPYRDSVLTWILKDSLGGNSKSFVIAAVCPSVGSFKETLNTLRFAQRANHVINQPVVNEEASVKLIRHLKGEVARLKSLLANINCDRRNSDVSTSNSIVQMMGTNQMKARELTDDWLQRWRSSRSPEEGPFHSRSIEVGVQTLPVSAPELDDGGEADVGLSETDAMLAKLNCLIEKLTIEDVPPRTYCRAIWCFNRHLRFVMHPKNEANDCRLCCCSRRTYLARFNCHRVKRLPPDIYSLPGEDWV